MSKRSNRPSQMHDSDNCSLARALNYSSIYLRAHSLAGTKEQEEREFRTSLFTIHHPSPDLETDGIIRTITENLVWRS